MADYSPFRSGRTLLVSRHPGAQCWLLAEAARRGWARAEMVPHLGPLIATDVVRVAGNLSLSLAATLHRRGIQLWHLDLPLDAGSRGVELSVDDMQRRGARLLQVKQLVLEKGE